MHKVLKIRLVLLAVVAITDLAVALSMQLAHFSGDVPKLQDNLYDVYNQARRLIRRGHNVRYQEQAKYMHLAQAQTLESLQGAGVSTRGISTGA